MQLNMLIREFHRQLINLLQEGQVSLAAIHAHKNQSIELDETLIRRYIPNETFSEFTELVSELNGGSTI